MLGSSVRNPDTAVQLRKKYDTRPISISQSLLVWLAAGIRHDVVLQVRKSDGDHTAAVQMLCTGLLNLVRRGTFGQSPCDILSSGMSKMQWGTILPVDTNFVEEAYESSGVNSWSRSVLAFRCIAGYQSHNYLINEWLGHKTTLTCDNPAQKNNAVAGP